MLSPQLQTSNLEECHSLVNHIKLNSCKGFCLLSLILKICYLHAGEVTSRVRVEQMPHHEDIDHVPPPLVLCQQVLCQQFVYPEKYANIVTTDPLHAKLNPLYWSSSAGKVDRVTL